MRLGEIEGSSTAAAKATKLAVPWSDVIAPIQGIDCTGPHATDFECQCRDGQALVDVRFSSNLGYSLLAVFTLGIVNLVDVEYSCAPQRGNHPSGPPALLP